jgi:hypothetical protein
MTRDSDLEQYWRTLKKGPAFLLLGQRYLAMETGEDPLLAAALRKYGDSLPADADYSDLFATAAPEAPESTLSWMDERASRIAVPEWLERVAGFPWSGLYTSAIDTVWLRAFRNGWRDVQPLFEERFKPASPRNRLVMNATVLFGSINRSDENERPPLTRNELRKRIQVAVALARRLPELITPAGSLSIEAISLDDWLSVEDLFPILDEFNHGQVHLFSANEALRSHPDLKLLSEQGVLVFHEASLARALSTGEQLGFLKLDTVPTDDSTGRRLTLGDINLQVPKDMWNQASRSGTVLDDSVIVVPNSLSDDARYRAFREFLSRSDGQPQWQSFARRFAYKREFEDALGAAVRAQLASGRLQDEPIILHGQTGTGKTTALASLAFQVRSESSYPVIFIQRSMRNPVAQDIDRFCQWAEDSGAQACLIVWDGMLEPDDYASLLRYLASRGRRVAVVGSCYPLLGEAGRRRLAFEAPARLSRSEQRGFAEFLGTFHPALKEALLRHAAVDDTFLVSLYRILPDTRSQIRQGVNLEVGRAEHLILERSRDATPVSVAATSLALALAEAGYLGSSASLSDDAKQIDTELVNDAQDLTGLIMVPGRFGLSVPIEQLLHAMGKQGYIDIVKLMDGIDVFRWIEEPDGSISVGPRNALEARLLTQTRLGGPQTEVAFATRLLIQTQPGVDQFSEGREVEFSLALVRAMGSNGQERAYFAPFFKELSLALRKVRLEGGIESPRLMLQEANLLREWAAEASRQTLPNIVDIESALSDVENVVRHALDVLKDDRRNRSIRSALLVELAAALTSRNLQAIQRHEPKTTLLRLFSEIRATLLEARKEEPSNVYPVDVLVRTTQDMLPELDTRDRMDAIADVLYALDVVENQELDPTQQEHFLNRRYQFASLIGLEQMASEAFDQLRAIGSTAGFYLKALQISGLPDAAKELTSGNIGHLEDALAYLRENAEHIKNDVRCLELQLDLWWMTHTGQRLFEGERIALPLHNEHWRELLSLVHAIDATRNSHRSTVLLFLNAMALFHLREYSQAFDLFREVERDSDRVRGRRRIVRSYLASTASGQPAKFNGQVSWATNEGTKGEVFVEGVRNVAFIPRDFGMPNARRGEAMPEFHIAFNFLGPIADPVTIHPR